MNGHGPIHHLVGSCKQHRPYREAKRLRSLEIAGPERFEKPSALRPPLGLNVRAPCRDVVGFLNLGRGVLRPSSSLARRRELGQARDGQGRASQAIGGALDVLGRPLRNVLSFCPHLNRQAAALGNF